MDADTARQTMVARHLRARGIRDSRVLTAMADVPREAFVPRDQAEHAYDDRPLPLGDGQTISQPYIVAVMAEALALQPNDTVLEIGTGSGYAVAVLARIAKQVYAIERTEALATVATERLSELGAANVEVRHGDGALGWTEHAPFDVIVVAAGGPDVPSALLAQLAIGGRLVMPIGTGREQELIRVTRIANDRFQHENLGGMTFVPRIGAQAWPEADASPRARLAAIPHRASPLLTAIRTGSTSAVSKLIAECAEPFEGIENAKIDGLLERIGDARIVLIGESTHGTSELYRMRSRITRQLIQRGGFQAVAIEADWPDAAVVNRYVRAEPGPARPWTPFARFPTWMWRNRETHAFVEWLRAFNAASGRDVRFVGLDLYSMYTSKYEVIRYLDRADPLAAELARTRYGRLTPWQHDPAAYGRAALLGHMQGCEHDVVAMLRRLLGRRLAYASQTGEAFFDAAHNACALGNAERYYRAMYYGAVESWNLRDQHMFDTLVSIAGHAGAPGKLIVWAHSSHLGDAAATEMAVRGEHNIGQLCRQRWGESVYAIGFGIDRGTMAVAPGWDEPMQRMRVRPARPGSYERLCHDTGHPSFALHLRAPRRRALRDELSEPRLERAIGVVYRPDTELESHYFQAALPMQFDEYVWIDETTAIAPLEATARSSVPSPHPLLR